MNKKSLDINSSKPLNTNNPDIIKNIKPDSLIFDKEQYINNIANILEGDAREKRKALEKENKIKIEELLEGQREVIRSGTFFIAEENLNESELKERLEIFDGVKFPNGSKAFEILVEIGENAVKNKYKLEKDKTITKKTAEEYKKFENWLISIEGNGYETKIITKNYIKAEELGETNTTKTTIKEGIIAKLYKRIHQLNNMDKDTIDTEYKEILNNNEFSEKGGAGLGLIEMRRKSKGGKIEFSPKPIITAQGDRFREIKIILHIPNEKNEEFSRKTKINKKEEIIIN